jgi:YVTN family beta-propeller protein
MFKLLSSILFITAGSLAFGSTPYAYVSNISGNNVSVVNAATFSVYTSVSVPTAPNGLAVTPDGTTVYVVSQDANIVSTISTSTNSIEASIALPPGSSPVQVAISPNGAYAYVVDQGTNSVSVISTASQSVVATIAVGFHPNGISFNPGGSYAYVANNYGGTVSVINTATNSVTSTFAANSGPTAVVMSPNGNYLYVANQWSGTVTVHAAATGLIVATISGFAYPNSIAITPDGNTLFVTNGNGGSVSAVSTASNTIQATVPTSSLPTAVAISTDGTQAYVVNEDGFSLSMINTTTFALTSTVNWVGVYPVAVATAPPVTSGGGCTYSISPGSASFGSSGGTGTVAVTASSGCGWTASSNAGWASITSGSSGSGNGTVGYSVSSNNTSGALSGSLTIAGETFSITESGTACSFSISPGSVTLGSTGGTGTVTVTAPSGCLWSAVSNSSFLSVTSGASGNGTGTVGYSAAPNTGTSSETGTLTIASQTFTVTETPVSFSSIFVNCGGPAYTDPSNNVWLADNSGNIASTTNPIGNTGVPMIYQSEKWSTGTLQYQYAVPNGSYNVTLKFAEFYLTQRGQRVVNLVINGVTVQSGFDILANTSVNTAYDLTFPVSVNAGQITVQLVPEVGTAKLNGLEISLN